MNTKDSKNLTPYMMFTVVDQTPNVSSSIFLKTLNPLLKVTNIN
jgi:hypothetical protein